ncbi:hypothetical protein C8R46DRAFT_89866 [Mycena filopes]|nr:hypothetical protein C8R46DRAFT_89866 [Mycena filopes]
MLCAAPNLLECTFCNIAFSERHYAPKTYFRTHPRLRHLHLGIPGDSDSATSASILHDVTLPALETLSIALLVDIPSHSVVDFLTRSSPPLRKLTIPAWTPLGQWTVETIEGLFGVLPRLTHLDLRKILPDIFEPMAIQALRQLPSLCSFSVDGFTPPTRSQFEEILRVLRTRPKIQSLSITWDHSEHCPDPDIVEALRELVAGGMEICVGSGGRNLV